ncbi:DUF2272 domain-containing protein [Variovorax arabinosiphilus]|uniref:DUF2272 domain-containing protein n=1 Tax=Variovorax arabinosiphilus TaxID=3053498 RepID=UPI00257765F7|nr:MULTISPECIES: DUF2272 domain-containing protein [unclassified Variovorax]MDM0121587.1 DUF2272 domain-containing protein [Variovorax sp. J2L1-78]MDM0130648.1 DUF2272 domain-containing protein [Variovorax sp. J2L1-63]MDM0234350.1 DUF2272 domain-containing protein [Variovorax sp. J2R1-6]
MSVDAILASFSKSLKCVALALASSGAAGAAADTASICLQTATQVTASPRAIAFATAAQQELQAFGGQTIDAEGRMVVAGNAEAEDTRRSLADRPPWQRVLGYWAAVDPQDGLLPSQVRFGAWRPADRRLLVQAIGQASAERLQGLGVGPDQGLEASEVRALQTAANRVAVIDTPWSAAFVSWLARQSGLVDGEFVFSEAHADYAGAAWQSGEAEATGAPTRYAMRACDITQTPPRVGDLVCQARGARAGLDTFARIGEVLAGRPTGGVALPMHCDAIVAVDASGFDAVGGNVLQSVTRRRLDFAPGTSVLDASYLAEGCTVGTPGCIDRHLSRQPWSLLLQWR